MFCGAFCLRQTLHRRTACRRVRKPRSAKVPTVLQPAARGGGCGAAVPGLPRLAPTCAVRHATTSPAKFFGEAAPYESARAGRAVQPLRSGYGSGTQPTTVRAACFHVLRGLSWLPYFSCSQVLCFRAAVASPPGGSSVVGGLVSVSPGCFHRARTLGRCGLYRFPRGVEKCTPLVLISERNEAASIKSTVAILWAPPNTRT